MSDNPRKGAPKGRRPVIWVLSEHPFEKVIVTDQDPDKDEGSFPKEHAISQYEKKHGVKPKFVLGPFYDKKGGNTNNKTKKTAKSIVRNISDIRLKSKQRRGIFNGWRGVANLIEGNDDEVYFIFLREVEPDKDKRREAPNPGVVNVSDIEFCD